MKKIILLLSAIFILTGISFATQKGQGEGDIFAGSCLATKGSVGLGDIHGMEVIWKDSDTVTIKTGYCEANGSYYELTSDLDHVMTTLVEAEDWHYVLIDPFSSTPPTLTIIDSTTEPAWVDAKQGYYASTYRCIGVFYSPSGSATISSVAMDRVSNKLIRYCGQDFGQAASDMDPDGAWQPPDDAETSTIVPVTAVELQARMSAFDAAAGCATAIISKEAADGGAVVVYSNYWRGLETVHHSLWIALGSTRNVRIAGDNDDENSLSMYVTGYGIRR